MSTIKSVFAFMVFATLGVSLFGLFIALAVNNGGFVVLCIMLLMVTTPLFLLSEAWL